MSQTQIQTQNQIEPELQLFFIHKDHILTKIKNKLMGDIYSDVYRKKLAEMHAIITYFPEMVEVTSGKHAILRELLEKGGWDIKDFKIDDSTIRECNYEVTIYYSSPNHRGFRIEYKINLPIEKEKWQVIEKHVEKLLEEYRKKEEEREKKRREREIKELKEKIEELREKIERRDREIERLVNKVMVYEQFLEENGRLLSEFRKWLKERASVEVDEEELIQKVAEKLREQEDEDYDPDP